MIRLVLITFVASSSSNSTEVDVFYESKPHKKLQILYYLFALIFFMSLWTMIVFFPLWTTRVCADGMSVIVMRCWEWVHH